MAGSFMKRCKAHPAGPAGTIGGCGRLIVPAVLVVLLVAVGDLMSPLFLVASVSLGHAELALGSTSSCDSSTTEQASTCCFGGTEHVALARSLNRIHGGSRLSRRHQDRLFPYPACNRLRSLSK